MQIPLENHLFSGEYSILILDFLARFVHEACIRGLSEAQPFLSISSFRTGFAQSQY